LIICNSRQEYEIRAHRDGGGIMSASYVNRMVFTLICISGAGAASQTATAQNAAPVIDLVTIRTDIERYEVVYPEFHFHDPSGTTQLIHREIIATDWPKPLRFNKGGAISISSEQQIKGTTFVGRWRCGPETYYLTIQAYMENLAGLKSNVVEYTIHCNGG
jgi:hypothetical protein